MQPAHWMQVASLPKNVNGKIDRKDLRERFATRLRAVPTGTGGQ
jgi:acyl-coenzyme A synthetase/AMP-(fatty) acid ligase